MALAMTVEAVSIVIHNRIGVIQEASDSFYREVTKPTRRLA